ncbi:Variable outer membrane protein [Borrelia duttonii CR2A]|uniref:Variable outer membrane protein n=1 Tax=Borrelia duttonii CR2A TaxID=1432657 RepID=W6TFP4_9SPIR|nr:Variable outer membrane protein [Borrelia duttonii CR2A]
MKKEKKEEGKGRVKVVILMMVMMMVMGCNSGGVSEGSQAKATKADGSVIDLKVIGEKIKSAVGVCRESKRSAYFS